MFTSRLHKRAPNLYFGKIQFTPKASSSRSTATEMRIRRTQRYRSWNTEKRTHCKEEWKIAAGDFESDALLSIWIVAHWIIIFFGALKWLQRIGTPCMGVLIREFQVIPIFWILTIVNNKISERKKINHFDSLTISRVHSFNHCTTRLAIVCLFVWRWFASFPCPCIKFTSIHKTFIAVSSHVLWCSLDSKLAPDFCSIRFDPINTPRLFNLFILELGWRWKFH